MTITLFSSISALLFESILTGVGGMQYRKLFEDELKVKTDIFAEQDGFVAAIDYFVNNLKVQDFSHQAPQQVYFYANIKRGRPELSAFSLMR